MNAPTVEALKKLPPGRFLTVEPCVDMSGVEREAVVWMWRDEQAVLRKAHFCIKTGEYLGDVI